MNLLLNIFLSKCFYSFTCGSDSKASACNVGDLGSIPWSGDPLEKEMATHSSIPAWKIPWMEEPRRLQSMGSQRIGHDWATSLHFTFISRNFKKIEVYQYEFCIFHIYVLICVICFSFSDLPHFVYPALVLSISL